MKYTTLVFLILFLIATCSLTPAKAQTPIDPQRTIVVGSETAYPPYSFTDEGNHPSGFNIDLTQAIAEAIGVKVEIRVEPWNQIRSGLQDGSIDVIAGMYYSQERDREVDFTNPFAIVQHTIFAHHKTPPIKQISDLTNHEVIVMNGDILHDYILEEGFYTDIRAVDTQSEALRLLNQGIADFALAARLPGLFWIDKLNLKDIEEKGPLVFKSEYCYAVREGDTFLQGEFNEGLMLVKQFGIYNDLTDQWFGVLDPWQKMKWQIYQYSALIVGIILLLLILTMGWIYLLRKSVQIKTANLQKEIQERKHIEERLLLATKSAKIGIWDYDLITHQLTWDERMFELYAIHPSDFSNLYDHWKRCLHPEDAERAHAEVQHALEKKREFHTQFRIVHPDGKIHYIEAHAINQLDETGKVIRMIGVNWDITNRIQAEYDNIRLKDQLYQSQKLESIGTLAGGIAHDFNNILVAILGYSDMVLQQLKPTDSIYNEIEQILKAGKRASALTNQLLAFSRKQIIQPIPMQLNEKIQDLEPILSRILGENIVIEIDIDPELPYINADPGQLDQVILNISTNARDAMKGGGVYTILTQTVNLTKDFSSNHITVPAGEYAKLEFEDQGCGIPEELQSKIYEPFFTTKEIGKGTGLGLSTVFGIVKQNKGYILIDSTINVGTTFSLYFPAYKQKTQQDNEEGISKSEQGPLSILVIEDESFVRDYIEKGLKNKGHKVYSAQDADEAYQLFNNHIENISLVITDVVLTNSNGREIASTLLEQKPNLHILYMSGYTEDNELIQGIGQQQYQFIHKPFTIDELLVRLNFMISRS